MVHTGDEQSHQADEGDLSILVSLWNSEAADRYQQAKQNVALVVAEEKSQLWEEFGEATEKDSLGKLSYPLSRSTKTVQLHVTFSMLLYH